MAEMHEDDKQLFSLVDERRRTAESYRRRYESDWYLNLAYYEGDQWCLWNGRSLFRPSFGPSRMTLTDNRIQPIVRQEVAKLTKTRPSWVAVPRGGEDRDINDATTAERLLEWGYDHLNFAAARHEAITWSRITGSGFVKTTWNPLVGETVDVLLKPDGSPVQHPTTGRMLMKGDMPEIEAIPGVTTKSLSQGEVCLDVRSPFDIFPDPLATSLHDARWIIDERVRSPEYIKQRYGRDIEPDAAADVGITQSRYMGNAGGKNIGVRVYEMWEAPSGSEPGRYVVWCRSGILAKGENPYGRIPYTMFTGVVVPGRFWPDAVVTQLRSPQVARNKLISQIAENAARTGNPSLIVDRLAGVSYQGIPGETIKVNGGSPTSIPQYLVPPPMQGYVFNLLEQLDASMLEISGSNEASNGQVPAGVTAASAISLIQEADATRIAPDVEAMENALSEIGQYVLELMAKHYTSERVTVIVGEDGVFDVDSFKADQNFRTPTAKVQAGSTFPRSLAAKQAAIRDMLNLFLQYGIPIAPDSLQRVLKDMQVGGLERVVNSITSDQMQIARETANWYRDKPLTVSPVDNHAAHIAGHENEAKGARFELLPDPKKQEMYAHIQDHQGLQAMAMGGMSAGPPQINPGPDQQPVPAGGSVPTAPSGNAAPMDPGGFTPNPTV